MAHPFDELDPRIVRDFLADHTMAEAEKHFGVSHYRMTKFVKTHSLRKQISALAASESKLALMSPEEFRNYYCTHTIADTLIHFDISYREFRVFCKRHSLFKTKNRAEELALIVESIDLEELTAFYRTHPIAETAEKYSLTVHEMTEFLKSLGIKKSPYPEFDEEFKRLERESVRIFYSTHTLQETADFFELDPKRLKRYLEVMELKRSRSGFDEETTNRNRIRILRDNFWSNPERTAESARKALETIEERYGDPDYRVKRVKEAVLEKYGKESVFQVPEFREKARATVFERYGVTNPGVLGGKEKQSKEELSLKPFMESLSLKSNMIRDGEEKPFVAFFKDGSKKYPDFYNKELKIAVEYNGSYWHKDPQQPIHWKQNWTDIGWKIAIIWDFERQGFLEMPPKNLEEILQRYPCSFRKECKESH